MQLATITRAIYPAFMAAFPFEVAPMRPRPVVIGEAAPRARKAKVAPAPAIAPAVSFDAQGRPVWAEWYVTEYAARRAAAASNATGKVKLQNRRPAWCSKLVNFRFDQDGRCFLRGESTTRFNLNMSLHMKEEPQE